MASARARERRAQEQALEQLCNGDGWQRERDEENELPPEPEPEPLPVNTTH